MHRILLVLGLSAIVGSSCLAKKQSVSGLEEAWNTANKPSELEPNYLPIFDKLPLEGKLEKTPWSDTYWASRSGGIAARWQSWISRPIFRRYPSESDVRRMSVDDLAGYSPSEKYDIFVGRFDFPLTESELNRTSRRDGSWEGLCHGWSPAALAYEEPKPVTIKGPSGISVPFGSSDIKALLSYFLGETKDIPVHFVGERCETNRSNDPGCRDVNAGSFHIILANETSLFKRGFVMDREPGPQVWNQPVWGYKSTVTAKKEGASPGAANGTVREVTLHTLVYFTNETDPSWNPTNNTDQHSDMYLELDYRLELNATGAIIGGAWFNGNHPDFAWRLSSVPFSGYLEHLKTIYDASIAASPAPVPEPPLLPKTPTP